MLRPNILSYLTYRDFLKDYFAFKRKENSNWSLNLWTKKLGKTSPATLSMILSGKRNIGKDLEAKLTEFFQFDESEKEYFHELIKIDAQAKFNSSYYIDLLFKSEVIQKNSEINNLFSYGFFLVQKMLLDVDATKDLAMLINKFADDIKNKFNTKTVQSVECEIKYSVRSKKLLDSRYK